MSQVTARKTNMNHQVNEICMSFMKAVIVMRRRTRRRLPDELDVASWSVLASDESDLEDESEDQRNKKKQEAHSGPSRHNCRRPQQVGHYYQ